MTAHFAAVESAAQRYNQVRMTTSSPGELLLALYDGLFRFLNGARICVERKEMARARELLSKSYAIISELYIALDHSLAPELCANLEALYGFAMDRVQLASRKALVEPIDEVIRVLSPLREAWQIAVPQATREQHEAHKAAESSRR
ncbi:MAG: Flagellar biosynthesis protein FliS [Polyangiaceae bacterium]|jgi:flagellar protein FliS|nr:Flagellar biosynthesis protein FliS [Polyangiaceae bacterium]